MSDIPNHGFSPLEKVLMGAIGALVSGIVILWRKTVSLTKSLVREKEARIREKDKHIEDLQDADRRAKEIEGVRPRPRTKGTGKKRR